MEPEEKHEENLILLVSLGRYEEALELKLDELLIGKEILWKLSICELEMDFNVHLFTVFILLLFHHFPVYNFKVCKKIYVAEVW